MFCWHLGFIVSTNKVFLASGTLWKKSSHYCKKSQRYSFSFPPLEEDQR